jgi:hypothetical protein
VGYKLRINNSVEVIPMTRSGFDNIMKATAEKCRNLDRFPPPPESHVCNECPIDPHTMRRVVRMVADVRNAMFLLTQTKEDETAIDLLSRYVTINALDQTLALLCGGLAPELGKMLRESYDE